MANVHDILSARAVTAARRWSTLAAAVVLAGCTTTVPGSPTQSPDTAPPALSVDPTQLDTGRYPTAPVPAAASTEHTGRLSEARRLAASVVGPWQVDPDLTRSAGNTAAVITGFDDLKAVLYATAMYKAPNLRSLLVGFSSERWATNPDDHTRLRNTVLRFPDPAGAAAIAAGLTDGTMTMLVRTDSVDPIPIEPIHTRPLTDDPTRSAVMLTFREGTTTVHEAILIAAHGPFVLIHSARTTDNPDHAVTLTARSLQMQIPLIDRFQPTPSSELATLPTDPTGLTARTVPASEPTALRSGTYDAAGALHLHPDPLTIDTALTDAGADVVSAALTTVYRTPSPASAETLAAHLSNADPGATPATAVPGLPNSQCQHHRASGGIIDRYRCIATTDRYTYSADSRDLTTTHQQMAAQYRMLTP